MTFDGASVLVTGGSRGIGKAIALRFAELGAKRVAIGYLRNDRAAEETAEELRGAGAEPLLLRGNVASERVAQEAAELGPFDVLVHNAATGVIKPALETEDKHWDWTLNANARALLTLARACAPQMPEGSSVDRRLEPRLDARARELRPRRRLEGGPGGGRPLPRGRARPARHPRERRVGRRGRDRRPRPLPEPRADDLEPASSAPRPGGSSSRATWPTRSASSARPRPRWCAARPSSSTAASRCSPGEGCTMEPTDTNLRAWEEAHKRIRRSSARGSRTLPKPVRERLAGHRRPPRAPPGLRRRARDRGAR